MPGDKMGWSDFFSNTKRIGSDYAAAVRSTAGGRPLSAVVVAYRLALARLRFGIGPRYYSLFELDQVPASRWNDFVIDAEAFSELLKSMSPDDQYQIARDKVLFHIHCRQHGLPNIAALCLVGAGCKQDYPELTVACTAEDFRAAVSTELEALFVKRVDGAFGSEAFWVDRVHGSWRFDGQQGSLSDLYSHLSSGSRSCRRWLIQPRVECHECLARIMSRGLGTIRAVAVNDHGCARLLYAVLKITVGENAADNFHGGTTGNLLARIDLESGSLSSARGSRRRDWPEITEVTNHPETGHRIEGFKMPFWDEVVNLVVRAQESLPLMKSAGWDVAVTAQGPVLVEVNLQYSTDILQVAYGRGLKHELLQHLGAVPSARQL